MIIPEYADAMESLGKGELTGAMKSELHYELTPAFLWT